MTTYGVYLKRLEVLEKRFEALKAEIDVTKHTIAVLRAEAEKDQAALGFAAPTSSKGSKAA